jgi:hypothetical protein
MIKDPIDGLELALRAVDELERERHPAPLDIGSITLDLDPVPRTPEGLRVLPPPASPAVPPAARIPGWAANAVLGIGLAAALAVAGFVFWPKGTHAQQAPAVTGLNPLVRKGLPDPLLTPGHFQEGAAVPADAPIPLDTQVEVLRAYGVTAGDTQYVVLRLIPPTLGGIDAPKNLFVTTPWFADLKARLDSRLTELVTARQISADHAREDLTRNWVQAVHGYYVRNYGHGDKEAARRKEDELRW